MRSIVDQNSDFQIAKISDRRNGQALNYQIEDKSKKPGQKGFVVNRCDTLGEARTVLGLNRPIKQTGELTKPKSAYPEQQSGYSRKR